ncbi:MAG: hypothetical protein IJE89_03960 [Bacilli bacterium]|nr:hypothetical protein [Bacilli bacterium]
MIVKLLKKIAIAIEKKQDNIFTYPIDKQQKYINKFEDPKNNIERSYFQYCCQMKLYGKPIHLLLNIASLPLVIFYMIKLKSVKLEKNTKDAVFFNDGKPFNIIPNSILKKYNDIITISSNERCLSKSDKRFLYKIFKKYPFSWLFWLKLIIKVSQYSYAINKYSPKAIICCSEFSFTSSILTEYCHLKNIKLINVMHGEKLYNINDSFAKFDEFYVWGQEYIDLLSLLRFDKKQFKIEVPSSLRIKKDNSVEIKYDFTYYLGGETIDELVRISENLRVIKNNGFKVSIRPHPRYSDMSEINKIFDFLDIENLEKTTIETSLLQTKNAISLFSTVLTQAYYSSIGIGIIIDDISVPNKYEKLEELKYIMISVEHKLLSELINKQ